MAEMYYNFVFFIDCLMCIGFETELALFIIYELF